VDLPPTARLKSSVLLWLSVSHRTQLY